MIVFFARILKIWYHHRNLVFYIYRVSRSSCMLEVKTKPQMRTVKKDKVICYLLNGKRDLEKEKKISALLYDVLKSVE